MNSSSFPSKRPRLPIFGDLILRGAEDDLAALEIVLDAEQVDRQMAR